MSLSTFIINCVILTEQNQACSNFNISKTGINTGKARSFRNSNFAETTCIYLKY